MSGSLKKMSDSRKKMSDSLIRSFLVSNLTDSLTSLTKKEEMSDSQIFYKKSNIKHSKKQDFRFFYPKFFEQIAYSLIS